MRDVYSAIFDAGTEVGGFLLLALLTAPIWLRVVNEVSCRTIGLAVVICPHCGVPGIIESEYPQVLQ